MSSHSYSPFKSPWWLPDRHTQTLWRRFAPTAGIRQRRERLELADGDFIDLDWVDADAALLGDLPVIVLLHGLCGCSGSPYMQSMQRLLHSKGYSSVAMNFRGCSGEINRLARAYHSGCIEDVEEVYQSLHARLAGRSLAFAGFSLGGNVLLKWLSEIGHRPDVLLGVAVSTPFSLSYCSGTLNTGVSKAYGHYFRRRLVRDVEAKKAWFRMSGKTTEFEKLEALGDLRRLQTLWEFDDQVTAPLHGFAGAEDYYERCSSGPVLPRIKTPVQLIQSGNDPIIPHCS
ncbi:MAG: alpha/beta fold hydrolase, partial [Gammaproteobacteria bacterium]|nr:alpha/beta fold hydrolase [Gammaproteobacteria bacterium]